MIDEIKTEEESKPVENINDGSKSETDGVIDRADRVAQRIEEANKKAEELLKRNEALEARFRLSGRSQAGMQEQEKSKDQLETEEAERFVKQFYGR